MAHPQLSGYVVPGKATAGGQRPCSEQKVQAAQAQGQEQVQQQQVIPPPPPCPGGFIYTVQPGDTLFLIAQRFGVSLDALLAANPQITNPNLIFPGQQICIPPVLRPFCVGILNATSNAPQSMGVAFVVPATGHAFILAHNMPPLDLGTTYVAWVRYLQTGAVIGIPLEVTGIQRTWIRIRESGSPFVSFEEVFVTSKPLVAPPPETPTGPRLIEGSIAHCR